MIRAAAFLLCATPAFAGERVTIHADPTPADGWFARIEVVNIKNTINRTYTFDTEHGPVTVKYRTIPNAPCPPWTWECADEITVVDLPDGVVAVPMAMLLLEDATEQILLFEYIGG